MLGPDHASNLGGWLVKKIGPLMSQHKTVRRNLQLAFPDWTEEQIAATALESWECVGRVAGELPHLGKLDPAKGDRVEIVGSEHYTAIQDSDKGGVMISGHFANWEVMCAVVTYFMPDIVITYRALNNPYIDRRIANARMTYGMAASAAKGIGTREMMRALSSGRSIGIMNDQKFNEGIAVKFFGHDAMTAPGPTRLAIKYGSPIVLTYTVRTGPARFRVTVYPPIQPHNTGDLQADIRTTVEEITAFIEARIRENPGQWFWQHRRWPKSAWKDAGIT